MVTYTCNHCNYSTKLKSNFDRHLKTKKHRVKTGTIMMDGKETTPMNINDHKMITNDHKMSPNDLKMTSNDLKMSPNEHKMSTNIKPFSCNFCGITFSTKPHKRRHELHYCKEIPVNNQYKKDKIEWVKEKNKLYNQIDALIKKVGNTTTTNNLNINSYGDEDMSHITDQFKTNLLKGPYGMITKMIEAVHFNDKKPENKNLTITNKKDNKIKIVKNGKWEYCKKSDILNDIINNNYYLLDSHYDDIGNEILNEIQKHQYSDFKKEFVKGDLTKETQEDIEILILNNDLVTK